MLATVAGGVIRGDDALQAIVSQTREAFGLEAVRLVVDGTARAWDGDPDISESSAPDSRLTSLRVGDHAKLELFGDDLEAADRRLLSVIVSQLDAALEHLDLTTAASEVGPLEETDRVRSALLAAVGHDLRRPLAAATAAITSLHSHVTPLSEQDRDELLETAESSLSALAELLTKLLDVSRVQAGVLAVSLTHVDIDDLLPSVLDELGIAPGEIVIDVPDDVPAVHADAVLLQRAIVNLLTNALRYSPPGRPPRLSASSFGGFVEIRVADAGKGVSDERKQEIFLPFQRVGDTDNTTGIGLGLALTKGFVEGMGGELTVEDTPAGGLTMVISLPVDERADLSRRT